LHCSLSTTESITEEKFDIDLVDFREFNHFSKDLIEPHHLMDREFLKSVEQLSLRGLRGTGNDLFAPIR